MSQAHIKVQVNQTHTYFHCMTHTGLLSIYASRSTKYCLVSNHGCDTAPQKKFTRGGKVSEGCVECRGSDIRGVQRPCRQRLQRKRHWCHIKLACADEGEELNSKHDGAPMYLLKLDFQSD